MVPELVTVAVVAEMPVAPPEMVPEFVTIAVGKRIPMLLPPEMVPELTNVAVPLPMMPSVGPEIVPVLPMVAPALPKMATFPEMVPEFVTFAMLAMMPLAVPEMVPKFVTVRVAVSLMPVAPPETVVPAWLVQVWLVPVVSHWARDWPGARSNAQASATPAAPGADRKTWIKPRHRTRSPHAQRYPFQSTRRGARKQVQPSEPPAFGFGVAAG